MWEGVGIDGYRNSVVNLMTYSTRNVINTFGRRKIIHMWHIVRKKVIKSVLRKPEQEEPLWRPGRII